MAINPTTVLGNGQAIVIALPRQFSLPRALRRATSIKLATAFAHMSGWRLLAPALRRSKARVDIITGLDFCQTEPAVLRDWLKLSRTGQVRAHLYPKASPCFHPKVLIVKSQNTAFAIVGSGNLSAGGLRDNVECSLHTRDPAVIQQLEGWFTQRLQQSPSLKKSDIDDYEPKYEAARKATRKIRAEQKKAEAALVSSSKNRLLAWSDAVQSAKRYFALKRFRKNDRTQWTSSARQIRRRLDYPRFNFNSSEWAAFYEIEELGNLVPIYRNQLFRRRRLLRRGLRQLIDETVPIHKRINAVLDPKQALALRGLGINLVTKILAAHQPKQWPVFNGPVREVLERFGYEEPRGSDTGEKYAAFARLMKDFMQQTGAPDMIALDCFFYRQSES